MPRARNEIWVTCTDLKRWFGVHPDTLEKRDVRQRKPLLATAVEYDVDDFLAKCPDLVTKKFGTPADMEEPRSPKDRKELAQALKVELENAKAQGKLVPANMVEQAYLRCLREMADELSSIPTLVRNARPDIPAADLEVIERAVAEARNRAAKTNFSEILNT